MNTYLITFGLFFFAITAIFRRDLALYLIILLLPTYQIRFQIFGIPATFLEAMILILAAIELGSRILSFSRRRESRAWIPRSSRGMTLIFIFLFLLAAFISIFTAPDLVKAAGIFKAYFFEAVLFYFLVLLIIDSQEKTKHLFKTFAILVLYLSLFGIYQFITLYGLPFNWWAVDVESRRIISVLNHPNALALLIGPILGILIFLPEKTKLHWGAILTGLVAFYLSFSRAGWLALAATTLGLSLFTSYRRKIIIGAIAAIILVMLIPFSRVKILDLTRDQDPSKQNRYVLWSAALDILKKSPLTGTGLAGFREAYKNYPLGPDRVIQNYPHNFFLNFWTETGLLGLLAIVGLIIIFFKKIWDARDSPYALAAAAGLMIVVVHGLVDVPYFKNDLSVVFWLIYSLPFVGTKS